MSIVARGRDSSLAGRSDASSLSPVPGGASPPETPSGEGAANTGLKRRGIAFTSDIFVYDRNGIWKPLI